MVIDVSDQSGERLKLEFPKLDCQFSGNGDLFTALILAWINEGLQVQYSSVCMCYIIIIQIHSF